MKRRQWLQMSVASLFAGPVMAAFRREGLEAAAAILSAAVEKKQVAAAVLHVRQNDSAFTRKFGTAATEDAQFLLGSITKPICVTALMTLFDKGEFRLDDPLVKFLPRFTGDRRDQVTLKHLLTHVSGLPDQLPENAALRKRHASLAEFVDHALKTPLGFAPGERYQYSSMGILLATHLAERLSGQSILEFVDRSVFQPLKMQHSVLGVGRFDLKDLLPMQIEHAAPEAGAGDPTAKDWDWNSPYWRRLGAPWGGAHCSARDLDRFLDEFLSARGMVVKPQTAKLMTTNQNAPGLTARGLGFHVGRSLAGEGSSDQTFGHTGSTGTIAWADPATGSLCVILTTLPAQAVQPHPRTLATAQVAAAVK